MVTSPLRYRTDLRAAHEKLAALPTHTASLPAGRGPLLIEPKERASRGSSQGLSALVRCAGTSHGRTIQKVAVPGMPDRRLAGAPTDASECLPRAT